MPSLPAGHRLVAMGTVTSSNDEAKRLAFDGAPDGTVVWAEAQSAGRGRRGRDWVSPPGNLYLSLLLRPGCEPKTAPQLGFAAALAVAEALEPWVAGDVPITLKWPNDVLLDGAKVGGILLESAMGASKAAIEWLVVGIGINLVSHPDGAGYGATSVAASREGPPLDAGQMLSAVVERFAAWRARWVGEGFAPVRGAWLDRAHRLGREIELRGPEGPISGRFAGIDDDGALVLDRADGQRLSLSLGEVAASGG